MNAWAVDVTAAAGRHADIFLAAAAAAGLWVYIDATP